MRSDAKREDAKGLRRELTAAVSEVAALRAENAELKLLLVESQKALEAAESDVERYRQLIERARPNEPEHVPTRTQQLILEGLEEAFATRHPDNDASSASGANDDAAAQPEPSVEAPHAPTPAADPAATPERRRPGHGRRNLSLAGLTKREILLPPAEVTADNAAEFRYVKDEISERIAYEPAQLVRLVLRRPVFERITPLETPSDEVDGEAYAKSPLVTAPLPDALWARIMADPSAIAHAIVSKYDDLLPLHRQETISTRLGFTLPRSTLGNWLAPAADYLGPIVDAMFADGKKSAPYLAVDATSASVRGAAKGKCEPWHVFVFIAPEQHIVFRHARVHDSVVLGQMLKGYRGKLLADASSIYSPLATAGTILLVCCWAHVRRYFFKAASSDPRALEAIAIIGRLFAAERVCMDLTGDEKTRRRAALAEPVLALFDAWMDRHRPTLNPRTPLAAAFTYADNQRVELRRFLEDGRLRIDNNVCEGQLRNLVLGQNNWQRFERETGLRWYTVFRSLIASAKLHGLCPQRYLECVLRLAPHWKKSRVLELSPRHFRDAMTRLSPEQLATVSPSWSTAFQAFAPAEATPDGGIAA